MRTYICTSDGYYFSNWPVKGLYSGSYEKSKSVHFLLPENSKIWLLVKSYNSAVGLAVMSQLISDV